MAGWICLPDRAASRVGWIWDRSAAMLVGLAAGSSWPKGTK